MTCFRTLVGIVDTASQTGQEEALRTYIRLQFYTEGDRIHEALFKFLPLLLRPAYTDLSTTMALLRQSWFFLEVAAKSMGQQLLAEGKNKVW